MIIFYWTIIGLKVYFEHDSLIQFFISVTKASTENRITKISKREPIRGNTTRLNKRVILIYRENWLKCYEEGWERMLKSREAVKERLLS